MAHIQRRETAMRRNGRPVVRWEVHWDERVRTADGALIKTRRADGALITKTRRRQKSFDARADAEAFKTTVDADRLAGVVRDHRAGETELGEVARTWLALMEARVGAPRGLKPKTFESYETAVRLRILPALGTTTLDNVSIVRCDEFAARLTAEGLSASSVRTVLGVLRRILGYAVRAGKLTSNPAKEVDLPTARKLGEDFEPFVLSPDDVERVAAELSAPYDLCVLFAAYTGLRQGEQAALNVSDVAVTATPTGHVGTVTVRRTAEKIKGGWRVTEPKSKRSRRTVPMPGWLASEMAAYLAAHLRRDEPDAPLWPSRAKGGHHDRSGRYATGHGELTYAERWEPTAFCRTIYKPALRAAGLPVATGDGTTGVRWHDLRHFFASVALASDVPVMQVSTWLGHASTS